MAITKATGQFVPRIEYLRVKNYRALRDLELKNITPLTVFLVPMAVENQLSLISLRFYRNASRRICVQPGTGAGDSKNFAAVGQMCRLYSN